MYVQVIKAKVGDADVVKAASDRWRRDLKPGAVGYLGSIHGATDDGTHFSIVRFDSEASARANSERPEQGEWWKDLEAGLEGPVEFHDCSEVDVLLGGGSDPAGFVQVIEGRAKDQAKMRAMATEMVEQLRGQRPDIVSITVAWHGDGGFTQAVSFRTEEAARAAEGDEANDGSRDEFFDLFDGPPAFYDLRHPEFD